MEEETADARVAPLVVTPEMERAVRNHWDTHPQWHGPRIFISDRGHIDDVVKVVTTMRYFSQDTPYTQEEQEGEDWGPRPTAEWEVVQEMLDKDNTVLSRVHFLPCSCCGGEWNLENAFDEAKDWALTYAEIGQHGGELRERKQRYSKWFKHYPLWRRVWKRVVVYNYWRAVHNFDSVRWFLQDFADWTGLHKSDRDRWFLEERFGWLRHPFQKLDNE